MQASLNIDKGMFKYTCYGINKIWRFSMAKMIYILSNAEINKGWEIKFSS